jgi:phage terminase large subunit-like protein
MNGMTSPLIPHRHKACAISWEIVKQNLGSALVRVADVVMFEFMVDDVSGVMSPLEWGRQAISIYNARCADRIVAEKNNGGEMVEQTLRSIDPNVSYSPVWASKGKVTRAEPIHYPRNASWCAPAR